MDQEELVATIGDTLTDLDGLLISPAVNADPAKKQALTALRNNLDDQQRELVKAVLDADTVEFKTQAGLIDKAKEQLDAQLDRMDTIDDIFKTISTISGAVDSILTKIP
jgi:hypothetical protein